MFGFPQQMAALRDMLAHFLTDVFRSTRFDRQPLLRGVYFTSGTQEGTPIDRLLVAIGRDFAIRSDTVATSGGRGMYTGRIFGRNGVLAAGLRESYPNVTGYTLGYYSRVPIRSRPATPIASNCRRRGTAN